MAQVQLENPHNLPLPTAVEALLRRMFPAHRRVIVTAELGSGLSGSRVFVVHPIAETPELPAVVKIAPAALVEQEYRAYHAHIRHKLSGAAEIRSEPALLPAGEAGTPAWGGLRYDLVGSGVFEIESLNAFCRRASLPDIQHVLEKRLFRRMGPLWRFSDTRPHFDWRASYDHVLPVNCLVQPQRLPPGTAIHRPGADPRSALKRGDGVQLDGLTVLEVDPAHKSVTLDVPRGSQDSYPQDSYPQDSYPQDSNIWPTCRMRLLPVEQVSSYRPGDSVGPIEGVIVATRGDLLWEQVTRALGGESPADSDRLRLPGQADVTLPNPLAALPELLAESRHVRLAWIHGDLNLENVLVDPEARDVCLIDFAQARRDHVLHDLLRLETGVVTWLLPDVLHQAGLPPETIYPLYAELHQAAGHSADDELPPRQLDPALEKVFGMLAAVRRMARECLFDSQDWGEYYQGLTLYLLGALKFKNLEKAPSAPLPKQVAFWGAATALHLLQSPAPLRNGAAPLRNGAAPLRNGAPAAMPVELPAFIAGPPITHPCQFFGRERELKRLFNLWKRAPLQNAALVGPRRSGKSSLLLYLKNITTARPPQLRPSQRTDWLPEPQRYTWIFVDFQDARLGRQAELLRYILAGMNLPQPSPCDLDCFMNVVSEGLHSPTVILLDEIDVALQRYAELDDAFWESLRSLATNQVGGNLAFVLASHEPPDVLAHQWQIGSPFFNIFGYTARLGPLTEAEARQLVAASPLAFPPADVDWLLAQSGCWPLLVQILCRERLLALESGEGDDAWREEGLRQIAPFQHLMRET